MFRSDLPREPMGKVQFTGNRLCVVHSEMNLHSFCHLHICVLPLLEPIRIRAWHGEGRDQSFAKQTRIHFAPQPEALHRIVAFRVIGDPHHLRGWSLIPITQPALRGRRKSEVPNCVRFPRCRWKSVEQKLIEMRDAVFTGTKPQPGSGGCKNRPA